VYDAVVMKILGARRMDVLRAYALEYAMLGAAAAALAALVGSIAGYVVVVHVMNASWVWLPGTVLLTAAISLVVTMAFGLAGAWAALGAKAAPLLRN
jgi:putative ABC transport system permease protein